MGGKGRKERFSVERALRAALFPCLIALVLALSFTMHTLSVGKHERRIVEGILSAAEHDLGSALAALVSRGKVLQDAAASDPALKDSTIASISKEILSGNPLITGISSAPGAVIRQYFPVDEGESRVGHDLLSNPERRDALVKAADTREAVVSGPFESVEGNPVFFVRYPVYTGDKLWGFFSLTVDFAAFLQSLELTARYPNIIFTLSDGEARLDTGSIFPEESLAYRSGLASAELGVAGTAWRLYALPEGGWSNTDPALYALFAAGLLSAIMLFLARYRAEGSPGKIADPEEATSDDYPPSPTAYAGTIPLPRSNPAASQATAAVEFATSLADAGVTSTPPAAVTSTPPTAAKADVPDEYLFPDISSIEKKRGKAIKFVGPAVKGELYMPDRLRSSGASEPVLSEPGQSVPESSIPGTAASAEAVLLTAGQVRKKEQPDRTTVDQKTGAPAPKRSVPAQELLFFIEEVSRPHPEKILVVDDSEVNRDLVGRMLSLRNYSAEFAASGEAAIEMCGRVRYDIIFMDCFMPGMDGYKTAETIRTAFPELRAKIIGMSARVEARELDHCRSSGMDSLLAKPFTLKQLIQSLEGV